MHRPANFGDAIDRAAPPDEIALIDLSGSAPREFTRHELLARVQGVSGELTARGLGRGDKVAILGSNRMEYLAAYLGVMYAGLVAVPVNYKLPPEIVTWLIGDCGARFAFVDPERERLCPAQLQRVNLEDLERFMSSESCAPVSPRAGEIATILYTSGSSGRPKGVMLSHRGCLWTPVDGAAAKLASVEERWTFASPYYHMGGLFASIYTLMGRGMFVLLPPFSARGYIEAVVRYRCTSLSCVPAMMALIARERALLSQVDLRHVRDVHVGSAPLTDALVRKIREMFPEASVHNGYGSTEAGFGVFGPHPDGIATPTLSVGYPLRGVETHLVGCDDEGVLEVRSPAVMAGYQNLPEETAARMHDGWFNTGDIMRRDRDGFYFFVGRADDMFVCGGENIYPAMVESQLERHPAVLQACVVPVPDDIKGQVPVAFVVSRPNMHVDPEEVKQFALRHGPAYAHPRHIEVLQELPLQGTNKVDRRTLSKRAQETRLNREQVG